MQVKGASEGILIEVFESDKNRVGKRIDTEEPEGSIYTVSLGGIRTAGHGKKEMSGWKWFVFPQGG